MENSKINKIVNLVRKREFASLLKMAVKSTIPRKIFYFDKLYIVGTESVNMKPRRNSKTSFRQAYASEIKMLASIYRNETVLEKRFNNNVGCYVAEIDDTIAGIVWLKFEENYRTNCEYAFTPKKKYAWVYDEYVVPKYRLRGVFQKMLIESLKIVKSRSYEGYCGEIHYENTLSLNSHRRLGFNILEEISYVNFLGLFVYYIKNHETKTSRIYPMFVNPFKIGSRYI